MDRWDWFLFGVEIRGIKPLPWSIRQCRKIVEILMIVDSSRFDKSDLALSDTSRNDIFSIAHIVESDNQFLCVSDELHTQNCGRKRLNRWPNGWGGSESFVLRWNWYNFYTEECCFCPSWCTQKITFLAFEALCITNKAESKGSTSMVVFVWLTSCLRK